MINKVKLHNSYLFKALLYNILKVSLPYSSSLSLLLLCQFLSLYFSILQSVTLFRCLSFFPSLSQLFYDSLFFSHSLSLSNYLSLSSVQSFCSTFIPLFLSLCVSSFHSPLFPLLLHVHSLSLSLSVFLPLPHLLLIYPSPANLSFRTACHSSLSLPLSFHRCLCRTFLPRLSLTLSHQPASLYFALSTR